MTTYLNEPQKKFKEACVKEVEEMALHPLSHEQFLEQIERNRKDSDLQGSHNTE